MTDDPIQEPKAISGVKAVAWLVPLYLLIPLPTIWWTRKICLLDRDDCGYRGIIETIESSLLLQIVCLLLIGLLIFITAHIVVLARRGTLGVQQDGDEKRYGFNGLLVTVVTYAAFLGIASAVIVDAADSLEPFSIEAVDSYFWKSYGALIGVGVLATVLWHINEYSARPAPKLLQAVLFAASLGGIYWIGKLPV
jgi:hypothetical protein